MRCRLVTRFCRDRMSMYCVKRMTEGASKTKRGERIRTPKSISSGSATRRHTSAKAFGAVTRLNGSYEALSNRTFRPDIITLILYFPCHVIQYKLEVILR